MDTHGGPVVLINLFEVPPGADKGFTASWERARDFLAAQPGYRSTELHRSLGPDAEFRFVNVAEWASPAAFRLPPPTRLPGSGHAVCCPSRPIPSRPGGSTPG